MSRRVTATEAARQFSDLLNRVRYEGETFVIVRGGEEVGQLVPTQPSLPLTLRGLFEILDSEAAPDPEFADDLEAVLTWDQRHFGKIEMLKLAPLPPSP